MKLSEILPEYPIKPGKTIELTTVAVSETLMSCDREIDREALAKVIADYCNKNSLLYDGCKGLAQAIISTMPTWLKRIEE